MLSSIFLAFSALVTEWANTVQEQFTVDVGKSKELGAHLKDLKILSYDTCYILEPARLSLVKMNPWFYNVCHWESMNQLMEFEIRT